MSKNVTLEIVIEAAAREAYDSNWRDWDDYENNRLAAIDAALEMSGGVK